MGPFFDSLVVPRYTVISRFSDYFDLLNSFHCIFSSCREGKYEALKVVKSAQHYTETATDEIRLLEVIRENSAKHPYSEKIVRLLNHFTVRGVNGVHTCLVFEALGCSLYKLIVKSNYQGLAVLQVKSIVRQVSTECEAICCLIDKAYLIFIRSGIAGITLSAH